MNNQNGCIALVDQLAAWARKLQTRVILVWDNAQTHVAKKIQAHLSQPSVHRWVRVFWLSTYSPDLNDIERLWRYLKRAGVANYLFDSFNRFQRHLIRVLKDVNQKRHPNSLVFSVFRRAA
jgi:transposase